jgi:hypothetical protein
MVNHAHSDYRLRSPRCRIEGHTVTGPVSRVFAQFHKSAETLPRFGPHTPILPESGDQGYTIRLRGGKLSPMANIASGVLEKALRP